MSRPKRKNSTSEDIPTTVPATKRARPERNGTEKNGAEKPEKATTTRRAVKASSSAANLEPKKAPTKTKVTKASSEPNLASKTNGKTNGKTSPRTAAPPPPSLHALPTPPEHARPCYRVYTTGANDFGMQGFGMAPGAEMGRTKLGPNRLVDEAAAAGAYGDEPGAGFEAIAASGFHTVFVDEVGKVWTVGANDNGALGRDTLNVKDPKTNEVLPEREAQAIPGVVQTLADESFRAVKIAASNSAVAAISDKGEIRVWGSFRGDDHKFLGMAGLKEKLLPVPLVLEGAKARDRHHALAVDAAAGAEHFVFLSTQGEVYTCGAGHLGQLGRRVLARGSRQVQGTNPQHIVLGSGRGAGRKAMLIRAGGHMSFAVDASGDTWAWGINGDGQTGTGLVDDKNDLMISAPKKVLGLSKEELGGETVVDIAGGAMHAVFLTSDGRLFACGAVDSGRLGLAPDHPALADKPRFLDHPTEIPWPDPEDKPVQLSATTDGTMARTEAGALYSWGSSPAIGELGFGKDEDDEAILTSETPKRIVKKAGGPLACVAVACGAQHSVTLMKVRN